MSASQPFDKKAPRKSWTAHGLDCVIMDAPLYGAINGYVRHPDGGSWPMARVNLVEVHGGVTHGPCRDGWFGFDTLHSGDLWPGMDVRTTQWDRTWTEAQVVAETERMAVSILAAAAHRFTLDEVLDLAGLTYTDLALEVTS